MSYWTDKNIHIIGGRCIGKTYNLIQGAAFRKIRNVIMHQPKYGIMALEDLGLDKKDFNIINYSNFIKNKDIWSEPFVIDDIDMFLKWTFEGYRGFSMTINDSENG